jgi:peptidoglycan/LPS O-acetylase OafA/YrhL
MKRSFGIDFIRTFAIALVIFRHYGYYTGFNYGHFAIEFLFVVSGFLIGQILFNDFFSTESIEPASLKRFMIRRWFRILPLYYFCLLVKFIIAPQIGWKIFYYIFFLQNHFYGIDFYPVSWTLVIDEWFYLGVPLMLFLFIRFVAHKSNHILGFIIGVIVAINLARFFWVNQTDAQWQGLVGNVPFRQDTLLFGVLLAFIKKKYNTVFQRLDNPVAFLIALGGVVAFIFVMRSIRYPVDNVNEYIWTRTFAFSIISFLIMLTLPWLENSFPVSDKPVFRRWNSFIVWGSKLSYALYLVHADVKHIFLPHLLDLGIPELIAGLILIGISIAISVILYKILEKPLLIVRDKYFPDRPHIIPNQVEKV